MYYASPEKSGNGAGRVKIGSSIRAYACEHNGTGFVVRSLIYDTGHFFVHWDDIWQTILQ